MGNVINKMIFNVPHEGFYEKLDIDFIYIETEDNEKIAAHYINRNNLLTVLFCHGNSENIYMLYDYFYEVSETWNVNILLYDYPGYGESTGTPTEENMYKSGYAVYDYMVNTLNIKPETIILYGRSIGSCAAVDIAINRKVKGVILQSAILSLFNICFKTRYILPFDSLCNIKKIDMIPCYVFFIHGMNDKIVPFYHGLALYEKCKMKVCPYWVVNGKHNDVELIDNNKFNENIKFFLNFLNNS
ncbi:alpha/beta hydrolase, putative [Plasmodium chabaudi chabaudi]|uniref:Alpha/beta hydrolase, putative n=2 Tax=Plasmodium chabaudi TaxID=5825 RepID=A0A077TMD1_PLACU|nr:alpha/beta hydrolase, putative [Plasmodium chabaudi chabaudi]SCM23173.1 alpha/beta hydrolase, putative [Plasmodium chabaudi adami]SCM24947.1 alpha/beta hydrolase, putative [Plasmodium chabaudi chabaudi]SCN62174.1 alpha/beta hydrolase, putative [Plasmodium chabaudi chabaudi]SCN62175.1 alpha/beta hydrolase, putative [Plasmodium chabaudi adami]VTZ69734.1 alpha/beta hydrolase, putative [Plasmodium chabaudi chabaudi]|eukprot:XP_016654279.1 alpha/beta hydrolase, putative [Plasmodium chabaudi chabaudi]